MRLIQQDDAYGCAVACLAMVLKKTYAEMRTEVSHYWYAFHPLQRYQGLDHRDEQILLYKHGVTTMFMRPTIKGKALEKFLKGKVAILTVPSINVEGSFHGVVWDGKQILDPSKKKVQSKTRALNNCIGLRILVGYDVHPLYGIDGTKQAQET